MTAAAKPNLSVAPEAARISAAPATRSLRGDTPASALALQIAYPTPPAVSQAVAPEPAASLLTPAEVSEPKAKTKRPPKTRRKIFRRNKASEKASPPEALTAQRVRTTAYCRDEADHFTFGSMSAMGTPLRLGAVRSAAADWSVYPAGTRFRIDGDDAIYEIDDYGSALVGGATIDLYQPNEIAMEEWGVRHVDIEVLRWGSRSRSLEILRGRAGRPHIDAMIAALQSGPRAPEDTDGR